MRKFLLVLVALVVCTLVGFVPGAQASDVDFACASTSICNGTVVTSGANFSSTGISVFNFGGPYSSSVPFTLAFNTATGAISLSGTGALTGQNLSGTINSFTSFSGGGQTLVAMSISWTSVPSAVQTQLGTPQGQGISTVTFVLDGGAAASVDISIIPIPEPGTMALFGSGLFMIGGALRRKLGKK